MRTESSCLISHEQLLTQQNFIWSVFSFFYLFFLLAIGYSGSVPPHHQNLHPLHQRHVTIPTSVPQQQVFSLAEPPKRKPYHLLYSITRNSFFKKWGFAPSSLVLFPLRAPNSPEDSKNTLFFPRVSRLWMYFHVCSLCLICPSLYIYVCVCVFI